MTTAPALIAACGACQCIEPVSFAASTTWALNEPSGQRACFQGNFTFLLGFRRAFNKLGALRQAGPELDPIHSHGSDVILVYCPYQPSPKRLSCRSLPA